MDNNLLNLFIISIIIFIGIYFLKNPIDVKIEHLNYNEDDYEPQAKLGNLANDIKKNVNEVGGVNSLQKDKPFVETNTLLVSYDDKNKDNLYNFYYRLNNESSNNYFNRQEDISNYLLKKSTGYKRINTHRDVYRDILNKAIVVTKKNPLPTLKTDLLETDKLLFKNYLDIQKNTNEIDKLIPNLEKLNYHDYANFINTNYYKKNSKVLKNVIDQKNNEILEDELKKITQNEIVDDGIDESGNLIESKEKFDNKEYFNIEKYNEDKERLKLKHTIGIHNIVNKNLLKLQNIKERFRDNINKL